MDPMGILYLEPVNVLFFYKWPLQNKVFSHQNRGHLGSIRIYIFP